MGKDPKIKGQKTTKPVAEIAAQTIRAPETIKAPMVNNAFELDLPANDEWPSPGAKAAFLKWQSENTPMDRNFKMPTWRDSKKLVAMWNMISGDKLEQAILNSPYVDILALPTTEEMMGESADGLKEPYVTPAFFSYPWAWAYGMNGITDPDAVAAANLLPEEFRNIPLASSPKLRQASQPTLAQLINSRISRDAIKVFDGQRIIDNPRAFALLDAVAGAAVMVNRLYDINLLTGGRTSSKRRAIDFVINKLEQNVLDMAQRLNQEMGINTQYIKEGSPGDNAIQIFRSITNAGSERTMMLNQKFGDRINQLNLNPN